jgi:hypothetical protein
MIAVRIWTREHRSLRIANGDRGHGRRRTPAVCRSDHELVPVSADVCAHDLLLITHPEVRRDPKVRATAEFLKQLASEPPGMSGIDPRPSPVSAVIAPC